MAMEEGLWKNSLMIYLLKMVSFQLYGPSTGRGPRCGAWPGSGGLMSFCPEIMGNYMELWCFMEIYIWSDLIGFMNRQVVLLGLIGNKTSGSPTMKNRLNWWWFPHFGQIQHLLQWKMGCLDLQLMAMKWWQTWGFKPLDFGEGVAPFSSSIRWISARSHQKIGHAFIKARWPISPIMEGQCVCKCSQNENTNHIDPYRGTS